MDEYLAVTWRNAAQSELRRSKVTFFGCFWSPCAVNTRITYEFHSVTTWQRELVSQLTSIPQQEIQAEKRDIKKKKGESAKKERKKEALTFHPNGLWVQRFETDRKQVGEAY